MIESYVTRELERKMFFSQALGMNHEHRRDRRTYTAEANKWKGSERRPTEVSTGRHSTVSSDTGGGGSGAETQAKWRTDRVVGDGEEGVHSALAAPNTSPVTEDASIPLLSTSWSAFSCSEI